MKNTIRSWHFWALLFLGLGLMQGCSSVSSFFWPKPTLESVSIEAAKDVNGGYPIAIDLVQINEERLYSQLSGLKASEWFSNMPDYIRQYRKNLVVMRLEMVPGQKFSNVVVPDNKDAVGVLVFANYFGSRSYRGSVEGAKYLWIQLNKEDFVLKEYN